jgi:hypothetical protein
MRDSLARTFSNPRIFCTYKISSHLQIPQPLELPQFQHMRSSSGQLVSFLQMQEWGEGDIDLKEPNAWL